jgi:hypothetical protein
LRLAVAPSREDLCAGRPEKREHSAHLDIAGESGKPSVARDGVERIEHGALPGRMEKAAAFMAPSYATGRARGKKRVLHSLQS